MSKIGQMTGVFKILISFHRNCREHRVTSLIQTTTLEALNISYDLYHSQEL